MPMNICVIIRGGCQLSRDAYYKIISYKIIILYFFFLKKYMRVFLLQLQHVTVLVLVTVNCKLQYCKLL